MAGKYLKDKAYEIIRQKIIECEYIPGSILNEAELIKEIGASRTPIREALNKLEQENLVTIIPKKCIIVRGITIDDIAEVFDARAIIEPQILQIYGRQISKSFLKDYLKRCEEETDTQKQIRLDEEFHELLYQTCDNRYLREVLRMVEGMDHRNRVYKSNDERVREGIREHIKIIDELLKNDYAAAAKHMLEHIKNAKNYAMKKYIG
ncbi:GntR family transcriptional regulator [Clostridiaceae bacterium]|nr:GntR family transcriptional regulator [Clostridiaceae bacterium]RKI12841.1 GntR family transcriptional regulator [bacterium 1XD21-70]